MHKPLHGGLAALALSAIILGTTAHGAEQLDKDSMSHPDKYSYLQGYTLSQRLKAAGIEVNPDTFTKGIHDALTDSGPMFTPEETEAIIAEQEKIAAASEEAEKSVGAENLEKGKAFLEENAKKEGVTTLESGVQYRVIESGDPAGASPGPTDRVEVHYEGRRIDGKIFDSSYERGTPATFPLNGVVKGFSAALQNMKPGDKWEVFIPPHLGYGESARGKDIRPNETLIFTLELLGIQ